MDLEGLKKLIEKLPRGDMGLDNLIYHDESADELWANNWMGLIVVYDGEQLVKSAQSFRKMEQFAKIAEQRAAIVGEHPEAERLLWWNTDRDRPLASQASHSNDLFVEAELRGPHLFLRRGWNNGYMHEQHETLESSEAARALLERFSERYDKRLQRVGDTVLWTDADGKKRELPVIRELRGIHVEDLVYASCAVSGGTFWSTSKVDDRPSGEQECGSPEAARAAQEAFLNAHAAVGFLPKVLEITPSVYAG